MVIRPRADADADELVRMATRVQQVDGYPGRQPRDFRSFLYTSDGLAAWVTEWDGAIAGHVAVHRQSLPVVMAAAAAALDLDVDALGVVARLIVDPSRRRLGIGKALLETAAAGARHLGLHPVLDVATHYTPAIALYASCHWRNAGEVTMEFSDGTLLQSYVFVAPGGPRDAFGQRSLHRP